MSDRYTNDPPRQSVPGRSAGNRPAAPAQRPAGSAQGRPVSAQRPAGSPQGRPVSAQRPAGSPQGRPVSAQRPAGSAQGRPVSAQRPAGSAQGRPVSAQRPARSAQGRPVSAQRPPQQRRPAQIAYGRSAARRKKKGLSPLIRLLILVLAAWLLVALGITIVNRVRSTNPGPSISMQNPGESAVPSSPTDSQPTDAPTDAPTDVPTDMPTDEPTADPGVMSGRTARIRVMGDVIVDEDMLEFAYNKSADSYDFTNLFVHAQNVMGDADWSVINIEATLREGKYGYSGYPQFSTPPSILKTLTDCGVDMLTMCNNHALDGYFDGLKMSLDLAEEAGLKHVGAYRTQEEYDTPEVYDICGIKVGMLNYTQYTNGMASVSDKNASIYGMRLMEKANYAADIADLRAAGAEYVILIMHWGDEYQRYPEPETESLAQKLVAAGADLIIGGHPHVTQPAEYITAADANGSSRTALVLYSMGNFVSNHRHSRAAYTDNGVIFDFTLYESESGKIELADPNVIPVYTWKAGEGDYRVVPSGTYLNGTASAPAEMSSSEYSRMSDSYSEIKDLMGAVLPVRAD